MYEKEKEINETHLKEELEIESSIWEKHGSKIMDLAEGIYNPRIQKEEGPSVLLLIGLPGIYFLNLKDY